MNRDTFEKLVWDVVKDQRNQTMVVDNFHAYGIIKNRVDSFWEQVRLLQPDDDQLMILGGLVAIAAYAQLAAENLALAPEQLGYDDRHEAAEQDAIEAGGVFHRLISTINQSKQPVRSLQKGTPRFAFEFNADQLYAWIAQAHDISQEELA